MLIFSPFSRFFKLNVVEVTFSIFQFKYSITLCQPILLFISFSGSGSQVLKPVANKYLALIIIREKIPSAALEKTELPTMAL